jgi:hypothetical protein
MCPPHLRRQSHPAIDTSKWFMLDWQYATDKNVGMNNRL